VVVRWLLDTLVLQMPRASMVSNYDVHHHTTLLLSLHRYVGELIAAAAVGDSASLKAMELLATEAVQQLLYGDISLKIYSHCGQPGGGSSAHSLCANLFVFGSNSLSLTSKQVQKNNPD
jgi:hypothetical protein